MERFIALALQSCVCVCVCACMCVMVGGADLLWDSADGKQAPDVPSSPSGAGPRDTPAAYPWGIPRGGGYGWGTLRGPKAHWPFSHLSLSLSVNLDNCLLPPALCPLPSALSLPLACGSPPRIPLTLAPSLSLSLGACLRLSLPLPCAPSQLPLPLWRCLLPSIVGNALYHASGCRTRRWGVTQGIGAQCVGYPPPCVSHALVQATAGAGTVLIWYLILFGTNVVQPHKAWVGCQICQLHRVMGTFVVDVCPPEPT